MDYNKSMHRSDCLFFNEKYAEIQHLKNFQKFESAHYSICFSTSGNQAISLPKSPFGGFFSYNANKAELFRFFENVENSLRESGIHELVITQPQPIYPSVPGSWILDMGFSPVTREIAHHLPLDGTLKDRMHLMEKRKLNKSPFEISEEPTILNEAHDFLSACRTYQGLSISISFHKLKAQFEAFPGKFRIFTARKNQELAGVVIMNSPTDKIAYYFLPGTIPKFKKHSPMVSLIDFIFNAYQSQGFTHIDYGISSVGGKPQASLIKFKEHMGGVRSERITYSKVIAERK